MMPQARTAAVPILSEAAFGASVLAIAASRSLLALGESLHREVLHVTGSRAFGLYALEAGMPRLVFSRDASGDFLRAYDDDVIASRGDRFIDRLCDKRQALDGRTEAGPAWRGTRVFEFLHHWGFDQCMGAPLSAGGRTLGVIYTASAARAQPFGATALQRLDILCRAGSIALEHMLETGSVPDAPQRWSVAPPAADAASGLSAIDRLPRRSREVAALVSHGKTNKEIARALGLSAHTVKEYVGTLCRRLDAQNRTELARLVSELRG